MKNVLEAPEPIVGHPVFFPGDYPALRETLRGYLSGLKTRVAAAPFAGRVKLLLLAGGYGRGEGGVFLGAGEPKLYNDLEFYVVLKDGRGAGEVRAWCMEESHRGEEATGIEVEFKVLSYPALRGAEPSMFYYDLIAAHVRVHGDEAALRNLPGELRDAAAIPAHEATRLLFNRGTGLLFCEQALRSDSERVRDGFVERNHAKAKLAFGDAVLALNGRYHRSARERQRRAEEPLARLPGNWPQLAAWHAEAVEFKFFPRHEGVGRDELRRRQRALVDAWKDLFLWLEGVRLGRRFEGVEDYAAYEGRLFPESAAWKNGVLHARDAARRKVKLQGWRDYPRATLQRALASLLGGTEGEGEGERVAKAARLLGLGRDATREQVEEAYRRGWQYYN